MTEDLKNNEEFQLNEDPASSEKEQSPQIKEIQNADSDSSNIELPATLPILPLRGLVVYPFTAVPLTVGQPRSIKLVDEVMSSDRLIGLIATKQQDIENPGPNDLYTIGTAATIHRMFRAPDGTIRLVIQGIARFKITEFIQQEPYLKAIIEPHPEINESSLEEEAIARNVRDQFQHIAEMIPSIPAELVGSITSIQDPLQTAYTIANFQRMDLEDGQNLLELDSSLEKLKTLVTILLRESEVLELGQKIQNEAREEIDKVQREYFLREQLKAIQKELGEGDEQSADIEDFKSKISSSQMPEEPEKLAKRELDRLSRLPTAAAEYGVIRTFLEWLVSLPWSRTTTDNLDLQHAREILDKDHYGLEDVKERIIEFLAVRKLHKERGDFEDLKVVDEIRRDREGVILCFVGPPGVGKTSLGKSIASALGRKFIRISLGGVRDEAEIRGHRRTYIGAMPGRIIQSIRRVETKNPVFMLDEIDKLSSDFHGDPASALLEVLDPEQNNEFRDNYLEVPFDLSQVMFITTANQLGTIPLPLLDRMEVIFLSGYTENEKMNIAQKYLIPRQLRENSLHNNEIQFTNDAIYSIIRMYTKEAGVRNLEREIGNICRKVATKITEGKNDISEITPSSVKEFLGKPKYFETEEIIRRTSFPGVATGLAWTPVGGDILFIEATKMAGNKSFTITGSIGKVMQESAQIALSVLRSKSEELGIDPELFSKNEIHLHVPAGAQPKDGPSAGITMFTALASLFSNRLVKPDLAMTGEISLKGQVLPVGGIKEKVLAAHRSGIKTILLPKLNQLDFDDIPDEVKKSVNFIFVDTIDEVLDVALDQGNTNND
ncbi:MAG: endopeptidase La [Chloroflexi bacterium HGW-Chloroflexi-2]|jgi:ATP-dependent Lon protease|nr:MAG: endopeptidase La [Chloroflexi bacterium HGW-Chloroflexi-2]